MSALKKMRIIMIMLMILIVTVKFNEEISFDSKVKNKIIFGVILRQETYFVISRLPVRLSPLKNWTTNLPSLLKTEKKCSAIKLVKIKKFK